jgi:hypothetical protein
MATDPGEQPIRLAGETIGVSGSSEARLRLRADSPPTQTEPRVRSVRSASGARAASRR